MATTMVFFNDSITTIISGAKIDRVRELRANRQTKLVFAIMAPILWRTFTRTLFYKRKLFDKLARLEIFSRVWVFYDDDDCDETPCIATMTKYSR